MTSTQNLIDNFKKSSEFKSIEIVDVPKILSNQIQETDLTMLNCVVSDNKENFEFDLVLNLDYINKLDCDNVLYGKLLLDELIFCNHEDGHIITGCFYNDFENKGKPTYYIRPSDSFGVRLVSEYPEPLPNSLTLNLLLYRISKIDGVTKVTASKIVTQSLKDMVNCPDNEGLIFYVEAENAHDWRVGKYEENKTNCYWFVYPKSIWSNDVTFDKAIEAIEESFIAHRTGQPYPGKK